MNPNNYAKQCERALKRKLELIAYKGGECEECHYKRNITALEFHHTDPSTKDFQLDARHLSNTSIDRLKKEADKCELLCANCHRERHHPEYNENAIQSLLETYSSNCVKVMESKRKQSICPVCNNTFDYVKGKKYCSSKCRKEAEGKDKYPSKEEVEILYKELGSWEKVAQHYGLTRRIIQRIRSQEK